MLLPRVRAEAVEGGGAGGQPGGVPVQVVAHGVQDDPGEVPPAEGAECDGAEVAQLGHDEPDQPQSERGEDAANRADGEHHQVAAPVCSGRRGVVGVDFQVGP